MHCTIRTRSPERCLRPWGKYVPSCLQAAGSPPTSLRAMCSVEGTDGGQAGGRGEKEGGRKWWVLQAGCVGCTRPPQRHSGSHWCYNVKIATSPSNRNFSAPLYSYRITTVINQNIAMWHMTVCLTLPQRDPNVI